MTRTPSSIIGFCAVLALTTPGPLVAQTPLPGTVRDSVRLAIDRLAATGGTFDESYAAGDFTGEREPFTTLYRLTDRSADSVLTALVDCLTDSSSTPLQYGDRPLSRGATCYIVLHNLVYRETDPDDHWPGNFFGFPTPDRLREAQQAWRETIVHHWYIPS
jgi:hypothetical protein